MGGAFETTAVFVLLILAGLLWFGQRALIYFPASDVPSAADIGLHRTDRIAFETEDGLRLEGWYVPAEPPASGYTVLVFNGNAGHRGDRAQLADGLAARGVATLLFDYRGYGGNPGLPSERGLARDARAALAYLRQRSDVDPTRIAFFGESLGTGVAVGLAAEDPPAALILRSPFRSLVELGRRHYPILPLRWLLRDRYASIDRIARIQSPLLVIAGGADQIVPLDESLALYAAANDPKRVVVLENADHNDAELAVGPPVVEAIEDLLLGREVPHD